MVNLYSDQVNYKEQEAKAIRNRKSAKIINNILDDEEPENSVNPIQYYINLLLRIRLYDVLNLLKVYIKIALNLISLIGSLVFNTIYDFLLKREKSVMDTNVLITGSGGYLGRYLAIQFAKRGANLILWDCNEESNTKTLEAVKLYGCKKAHTYTVDISNEQELRKTANLTHQKFGFVSLVIMAAAPGVKPKSILDITYTEDVEKHVLVSYMSQIWLIQEFLPSMINQNTGHIATISSSTSVLDVPLTTVYSSMKSAQAKLIDTVREELRSNQIHNVHTSIVYLGMLNGGVADNFDRHFELKEFIKMKDIEQIAESITVGILKNKATIFVPWIGRAFFCLKHLVSPKIVSFLFQNLCKVRLSKLRLSPKVY